MLYLAPLQGYTDYIFREAFSKYFEGVDTVFIPYISLKNGAIPKNQLKEVLPENNSFKKTIPQVLFKDQQELIYLCSALASHGYAEMNLNLGCPYPMVTNRGKGSGLLPEPNKIQNILNECLPKIKNKVSVKLRTGLKNENEIFPIIEMLNQFDLSEIIYHPRLASQLYKGSINEIITEEVIKLSRHKIVLNGDINSLEIFNLQKAKFPAVTSWMLGRGILKNPFLMEEIKGILTNEADKMLRLKNFHNFLFNSYSEKLSGPGHLLTKMKQFWEYFSYSFSNQHKVFKLIKKVTGIQKYNEAIKKIFYNSL